MFQAIMPWFVEFKFDRPGYSHLTTWFDQNSFPSRA